MAEMPIEQILSLMIQERDRLNRAIEALQGSAHRGTLAPGMPKKRKAFSAATRRKMALAQKKRWAAAKAAQ